MKAVIIYDMLLSGLVANQQGSGRSSSPKVYGSNPIDIKSFFFHRVVPHCFSEENVQKGTEGY